MAMDLVIADESSHADIQIITAKEDLRRDFRKQIYEFQRVEQEKFDRAIELLPAKLTPPEENQIKVQKLTAETADLPGSEWN